MNKWSSAFIGAVAGVTASAVFLYLFAPARGATFDEKYQSRLDWALGEGEKAARAREQELLQELDEARRPPPPEIGSDALASPNAMQPPTPSAADEG